VLLFVLDLYEVTDKYIRKYYILLFFSFPPFQKDIHRSLVGISQKIALILYFFFFPTVDRGCIRSKYHD